MPNHTDEPADDTRDRSVDDSSERSADNFDESVDSDSDEHAPPWSTRLYRIACSVVVLVPLTVFGGFGGWLVFTITATLFGYDPRTADGDLLRDRLVEWPERNREVMRTDGRVPLPWKP